MTTAPLMPPYSASRWADANKGASRSYTSCRDVTRWVADGLLDRLFETLAAEADTEWVLVDSTTVKVHPQAAGAPRKRGR